MGVDAWLWTFDIVTIFGKKVRFYSLSMPEGGATEKDTPIHPAEFSKGMGELLRRNGSLMLMGAGSPDMGKYDLELHGQGFVNMEVQASGILATHVHSPIKVNVNIPDDSTMSLDGTEITKSQMN